MNKKQQTKQTVWAIIALIFYMNLYYTGLLFWVIVLLPVVVAIYNFSLGVYLQWKANE